jgi:hypothetical protein
VTIRKVATGRVRSAAYGGRLTAAIASAAPTVMAGGIAGKGLEIRALS